VGILEGDILQVISQMEAKEQANAARILREFELEVRMRNKEPRHSLSVCAGSSPELPEHSLQPDAMHEYARLCLCAECRACCRHFRT
jgi:hypothetical protein